MTDTPADDEPLLFDVPAVEPSTVAPARLPKNKRPPARAQMFNAPMATATTALGSLATLFALFPDPVPGIVLVDPRAIMVDPVNVNYGVPFDPEAHGELIESMRHQGNTVPVRLRLDPSGGPGFSCPSGSRRLGAALHLQQEQPGFRLRAIVAETMTDQEAFAIAEADNAGRTGIPAMLQARKWQEMLDGTFAGDRQAFIAATGKTASVVSRTLALLMFPRYVYDCCSDVEALNPYFAEALAPRIADPAEEPAICRRAEALIAARQRLPGPRLKIALLDDTVAKTPAAVAWTASDGQRALTAMRDRKGKIRIELAAGRTLTPAEHREIMKVIGVELKKTATT